MSVVCEMASPFIANSAVDGNEVFSPFRSHTSTCLKCQARQAAMTKMARELSAMGGDRIAAPADLEWRVMTSLEGDLAIARAWSRPIAWAAAVVSMAAAILIWRLRPRTS